MQAVVLVGGEGTRLRPLTLETPKPMVPIFGVPFLERALSRLRAAGIDEVILPAGYLPHAITSHFGDGSRMGLKIRYVIEETPLGTAGAIRNVAEYITGPFFVLNGDVLTSLDLGAMRDLHRVKGGLGLLHLIRVEDPSAFGCVVHDGAGRVSAFVEKPPRELAPTNEVNAGTYLLDRSVLDRIPAGRAVSIERETFPEILAAGEPLFAYATDDYWIDIGKPEAYRRAHRDVLDGRLALGALADPAANRGRFYAVGDPTPPGVVAPTFIGEDVAIGHGAIVGPYAVLGDGASVGDGARVIDAILWDAVRVAKNAVIEGAILASGVHVGARASVARGTVIGHDAEVDADAAIPPDARLTAAAPVAS